MSVLAKDITTPNDREWGVQVIEVESSLPRSPHVFQIGGAGDGYCRPHQSLVCKITLKQHRAVALLADIISPLE